MADFVVKKAIQDFAKRNNMMVGSDSYEAIDKAIHGMLKDASARCKANGRKTLKAHDF
jgi:histone H3/H4